MRVGPDVLQSITENRYELSGCWLWASEDIYTADYREILQQPTSLEATTIDQCRFKADEVVLVARSGPAPDAPVVFACTAYLLGDTDSIPTTATDHASLSGLLGTGPEYVHLNSAQQTGLVSAGDTALHYHAADRNRAYHTGTQLAATISDFASAADARIAAQKGAQSGLATLDTNTKIPLSQIPDAMIGQVKFQALWNQTTNSPTLPATPAAGTKGYYWICTDASQATFQGLVLNTGDWLIVNGNEGALSWGKVDNTDSVTSVFGRTGTITAQAADYSAFYQPLDSDLTAIAALTTTSFGRSLLTMADAAAARTAIGAQVAGSYQASSSVLTSIATQSSGTGLLKLTAGVASLDSSVYALASSVPVASSTTPAALGTAAVGTGTTWARADHVHAMPTAAQVGALGLTAQAADSAKLGGQLPSYYATASSLSGYLPLSAGSGNKLTALLYATGGVTVDASASTFWGVAGYSGAIFTGDVNGDVGLKASSGTFRLGVNAGVGTAAIAMTSSSVTVNFPLAGTTATMGLAKLGSSPTYANWAEFSHSSMFGGANYGFLQSNVGQTNINCAAGQSINFSVANGASILTISSSRVAVKTDLVIESGRALYLYGTTVAHFGGATWVDTSYAIRNAGKTLLSDSLTGTSATFSAGVGASGYWFTAGSGATGSQFIGGTVAENDGWRVGGIGASSNNGYLEIATADDGNEPIVVRQYSGWFSTVAREAQLLRADGNTSFPNTIYQRGGYAVWDSGNLAPGDYLTRVNSWDYNTGSRLFSATTTISNSAGMLRSSVAHTYTGDFPFFNNAPGFSVTHSRPNGTVSSGSLGMFAEIKQDGSFRGDIAFALNGTWLSALGIERAGSPSLVSRVNHYFNGFLYIPSLDGMYTIGNGSSTTSGFSIKRGTGADGHVLSRDQGFVTLGNAVNRTVVTGYEVQINGKTTIGSVIIDNVSNVVELRSVRYVVTIHSTATVTMNLGYNELYNSGTSLAYFPTATTGDVVIARGRSADSPTQTNIQASSVIIAKNGTTLANANVPYALTGVKTFIRTSPGAWQEI